MKRGILLAFLLAGCGAGEAGDAVCGYEPVKEVPPQDPEACVRAETDGPPRARVVGAPSCDAWQACIIGGPGESIELGRNIISQKGGTYLVTQWPCDAVPSCEEFKVVTDENGVPSVIAR